MLPSYYTIFYLTTLILLFLSRFQLYITVSFSRLHLLLCRYFPIFLSSETLQQFIISYSYISINVNAFSSQKFDTSLPRFRTFCSIVSFSVIGGIFLSQETVRSSLLRSNFLLQQHVKNFFLLTFASQFCRSISLYFFNVLDVLLTLFCETCQIYPNPILSKSSVGFFPILQILSCLSAVHKALVLVLPCPSEFLSNISWPNIVPCPSYCFFPTPFRQTCSLQIVMSLIHS
jgi:hypothetical protein